MPATPRLYAPPRRPYYIDAPAYRRTSAGIRVLHLLCHALNRIGEEAYICTEVTHPELDTPVLTPKIIEQHRRAEREPIVVYPEVVPGNPRRAASVVRYVLNKAGLLGGDEAYADTEMVFGYGRNVLPEGADPDSILFLPPIDTQIFNNLDNPDDTARKGVLFYPGRHHAAVAQHPDLAARATLITSDWPTSHAALAELFRRSEAVYCFESTAISVEAILCGCPAILLPSPFFSGTLLNEEELGRNGFAFGHSAEELAFARRTTGLMWNSYQAAEARFWRQLERFVDRTQAMPVHELSPPLPSDNPRFKEINDLYAIWRTRQTLQEIDAQLLAERMILKWTHRPGLHLLLALHPGEEALLADTLDSLAAQLYPEWLLTVVTTLDTPEGLGEVPNLQWLALRDATHMDYVIDEMAAASPAAWLARIEPGLTFEPHTLQVIADYINARPDWRLIYTDEDTREDDGRYTQPLFKPDLNLDLLHAQAYPGCLVVVEKQAFLAAGRYGGHTGAENYDLVLRVLDHAGEAAVGHIDQLLAHLPRASRRALDAKAEEAALADHLARRGLDATVHDGTLFGTRHVQYHWADQPLVSIIIQTRDREEYLRPLLESITERTTWPRYELVVVDNDSSDPDALAYLAALPAMAPWAGRCRVVPCPGEFSHARGANVGAAAAHGDYLLFLDNDTHVVQDDWLDRLMDVARRPDVGIVGPRLAYPESARLQHAPWVLGLRGIAASPWDGEFELGDAGYMGRALCDQEAGAVSGSALLVRRSAFERVGGMDAEHLPFLNGSADLCLRVRDIGLRTVWTPRVTLVHYGAVSLKARQRQQADALADVLAARRNHHAFIERWLPRLARDPFYNRNLSLTDPFKPEHVAPIDWDGNFHDRPRILGVPLTGGAGEYRLRAPLRAIGQAGLAQTMIVEPPRAFFVRILTPIEVARAAPDTLILHQPLDDAQTEALEGYARFNTGIKRIITLDDLITAVPAKNSFFKGSFKDARPRLRKVLGLADRLIVSTAPLADVCADMIGDLRIMPNCLEWSLWGDVAPPRMPRKKPRVGWAGAQQHLGDLELIFPVVEALADEVDWIFMGMCPDALKPFVHEAHGFEIDFQLYPAALARLDLDLAIAPLEVHAFNECKSNLRLLEYGAMGWPVICTDIHPYQNAPVTRLPNDPQRWIATIREQLAEPATLQAAGMALREWVMNGFILENHAAGWFAAYGP